MNIVKVRFVKSEIRRLLAAIKATEEEYAVSGDRMFYGSIAGATLRRASMDVTRALAQLRKP